MVVERKLDEGTQNRHVTEHVSVPINPQRHQLRRAFTERGIAFRLSQFFWYVYGSRKKVRHQIPLSHFKSAEGGGAEGGLAYTKQEYKSSGYCGVIIIILGMWVFSLLQFSTIRSCSGDSGELGFSR